MYKVIYNESVIDILKEIKYAKYMTKSKRIYVTDRFNFNCILASNNVEGYHLNGVPYPTGSNMKTVSLIEMSNAEIDELMESNDTVDTGLRAMRKVKIQELREHCNKAIVAGVNVMLSDNEYHHFALTIEDQLNLLEIQNLILMGENKIMYHETNGIHREFSVEDMSKIILSANRHKNDQLLHFNMLKKYVNQLTSIDAISAVDYNFVV